MSEIAKLKEELRLLKRRLWAAERLRHEALRAGQSKAKNNNLDSHLLAAGVAHEFNNILGAADGHAEWALESGQKEDMVEALQVVRQACERSLQITQSLQGLSSPEEESVSVFKLSSIKKDLLKHFKPLSQKLNIKLDVELDDVKVYGIETRFFEVLVNLIKNSFEVLSEEQAQKDFDPYVKVSSKLLTQKLRIDVLDNGAGVPEALREKIFQPFFTTKGRMAETIDPALLESKINQQLKGGSGLGLFLSQSIIAQMGGNIKLFPSANGAHFRITLPLSKL